MGIRFSIVLLFICNLLIAQERFSVYFDSNKFEVTKTEEGKLKAWIEANRTSKIVAINGYTDEVGSSGFNDTLAQKRVNFIFDYVKDKIKIRADFKARSFGENFNQSQNKAENRKATIYYILEKDLANENKILGIKDTIQNVEITEDMPIHQKIQLAKVGTKIILKNINFFQNTFAITPESNNALYDLLFVMQNNPNLKIQIQGHICCVDHDRKNLSLERAKQVRRFLVFKGILQHRVTVTGIGVREPLFPIPEANEEQAAANRRVEIEILSK